MLVYCCDYCENHNVQFEEGLDRLLSSSLFFNKGLLNEPNLQVSYWYGG